ncbi:amino acid permease [Ceratobasidium sp. AG-Ba]|nr:amino acid permease [Ceratobasidium sp. AG-Ba]
MAQPQKKFDNVEVPADNAGDDDAELLAMGYVPSFKREFTNVATISFAFSIMGLQNVFVYCNDFQHPAHTRGTSIGRVVLDSGSIHVFHPGRQYRGDCLRIPNRRWSLYGVRSTRSSQTESDLGWVVGWLNMLGQVAGVSSTEFGLANMIWGAVVISKKEKYEVSQGMVVGLMIALLVVHGILNSLATKWLARMTSGFVFVNVGATLLIIIVLLATTPRSEMHPASYVFGSAGIINQTGGWNTGIAFLFGLLSVQWTMTDYDATAHISEEVKRAAVAAPSAIFIAVIGTGLIGWLLNIVILCSGPLEDLPGPSGLAFLEIMYKRIGKGGALFLWFWVCLTAFFVVQTALQACSRTFYAFSRDRGLPDRGLFGKVTKNHVPLYAVWLVVFLTIFALTAMALDLSYIVPIFCRRLFRNHPEVHFKPGPFYMGDGALGWIVNTMCILWTIFVAIILALPTVRPVTKLNMNYASVITVGVMVCSLAWYFAGARKHYHGPTGNLGPSHSHHDNRSDKASDSDDDLRQRGTKFKVEAA